jgi:PLP dependent protein
MTDRVLANMLIGPQISAADTALANRLRELRGAIAAAAAAARRTEDCITLVAVSKGHEAARVRAAAALGVTDFGESYLQEALPKRRALADLPLTWHFIGRVQANKTRPIAESFDWVHALDRLHIAERLASQRPEGAAPLNVCIQVNIAAEASKGGVAPAELPALAADIARLPQLVLRGLMCMLPEGQGAERNRLQFRALRTLLTQLRSAADAGRGTHTGAGQHSAGGPLDTLSMGMSADFREAVLEGATLLRVGTALFGPRERGGGPPAARVG